MGPRNQILRVFVLAAERGLGRPAGEELNRGQRLVKFFVHFTPKLKVLALSSLLLNSIKLSGGRALQSINIF